MQPHSAHLRVCFAGTAQRASAPALSHMRIALASGRRGPATCSCPTEHTDRNLSPLLAPQSPLPTENLRGLISRPQVTCPFLFPTHRCVFVPVMPLHPNLGFRSPMGKVTGSQSRWASRESVRLGTFRPSASPFCRTDQCQDQDGLHALMLGANSENQDDDVIDDWCAILEWDADEG